jgi:hypothetical protein
MMSSLMFSFWPGGLHRGKEGERAPQLFHYGGRGDAGADLATRRGLRHSHLCLHHHYDCGQPRQATAPRLQGQEPPHTHIFQPLPGPGLRSRFSTTA